MQIIALLFVSFVAFAIGSPYHQTRTDDADIYLRLFTRRNPFVEEILTIGDYEDLLATNFDLTKPVKFYAHGRMSQWENPELVEAFLTNGDSNVIIIDWTQISNSLNETYLIESARLTGRYVAGFIDWITALGASFADVHIVGHSIGSHAAGYSGRFCQNGDVEIVTGLDPPLSAYELNSDHLNSNDAKYVEVIHTGYGAGNSFRDPIGTADFYPNGGASQPGCEGTGCSHGRAMELFTESLITDGFVSKKCTSLEEIEEGTCADLGRALMGGTGKAKDISGVYYLTTNAESPYAQGDI